MNTTNSNTLVALRIHAARLQESAMNLFDGGGPVSFEPRVEAAVMRMLLPMRCSEMSHRAQQQGGHDAR